MTQKLIPAQIKHNVLKYNHIQSQKSIIDFICFIYTCLLSFFTCFDKCFWSNPTNHRVKTSFSYKRRKRARNNKEIKNSQLIQMNANWERDLKTKKGQRIFHDSHIYLALISFSSLVLLSKKSLRISKRKKPSPNIMMSSNNGLIIKLNTFMNLLN